MTETDPDSRPRWSEIQAQAIGENVQTLRSKLQYSAEDLSRATGELVQQIPRSTIQKIETGGKKSVQLHEAMILAQALGVPLGYLLYSPYEPGKLVTSPYADEPVPAYWAADAMTPVRLAPLRSAGPNAWAVFFVQQRADALSQVLTDEPAMAKAERYAESLEALGSPTGAARLREVGEKIRDSLADAREQVERYVPVLRAFHIESWPIESHQVPMSFYGGGLPASYDSWNLENIYQHELELAESQGA